MSRVLLGLGGNVGDRAVHLRSGVRALAAAPGLELVALSPLYETEPVGGPPQPPFLNGCALFETAAAPRAVLELIHGAEAAAGRERTGRDHPRTLDVDLLLHGERAVDEPDLVVPHPRMAGRAFVLVPAADVGPGMRHPILGRTVAELLAALGPVSGVERYAPPEDWR